MTFRSSSRCGVNKQGKSGKHCRRHRAHFNQGRQSISSYGETCRPGWKLPTRHPTNVHQINSKVFWKQILPFNTVYVQVISLFPSYSPLLQPHSPPPTTSHSPPLYPFKINRTFVPSSWLVHSPFCAVLLESVTNLIYRKYNRYVSLSLNKSLIQRFSNMAPLIIMLNNRDYNIDQNNREYDFCHVRAALYL